MFDDILGAREEKVKLKRGSGVGAGPASVGGVDSPDGMDPNKKPISPSIGGLKGIPIPPIGGSAPPPNGKPVNTNKTTDPWNVDELKDEDEDELKDEDEDELKDESENDCICGDDCDCDGSCQGCLQDNDVWSTNPCAEVELP